MSLLNKLLWSAVVGITLSAGVPQTVQAAPPATYSISAPLADSWTWREFVKFWKRQLDKTAGVVGVVLLVGAGAVLLIVTKTRR